MFRPRWVGNKNVGFDFTFREFYFQLEIKYRTAPPTPTPTFLTPTLTQMTLLRRKQSVASQFASNWSSRYASVGFRRSRRRRRRQTNNRPSEVFFRQFKRLKNVRCRILQGDQKCNRGSWIFDQASIRCHVIWPNDNWPTASAEILLKWKGDKSLSDLTSCSHGFCFIRIGCIASSNLISFSSQPIVN